MKIFDSEGYIDSEVQEILYELGNVGLGMASITLGRIMGVRMHIGVPKVTPVNELITYNLESVEDEVSIWMDFQKTLSGSMIFVLKRHFVDEVVQKMGDREKVECDETEKISVIQEFANMICAAYLKAVGQYTGIRMYVKPAGLEIQKGNITLKQAYERIDDSCHKAICVDTGFSIAYDNKKVIDDVGHVIMLPDEKSVEKLIEPLCK